MTLPTHFHFGLGNLGLGLVIPLFAGKTSVYGFVRKTSSNPRYSVLEQKRTYGRSVVQANGDWLTDSFEFSGIIRYTASDFSSVTAKAGPPAIVTCAIKHEIATLYPLLAALIDRNREHYRRSPLIFLPFENAREVGRGAVRHIADVAPENVECIVAADSIVDKVCSEVRVENDECIVLCEESQEVSFTAARDDDQDRLTAAMARLSLDRFVCARPRFEFELRKKTWLVNGLHYCISMCAYHLRLPVRTVQEAVANASIGDTAAQFAFEMLMALRFWAEGQRLTVDEDLLLSYAERAWTRMHSPPLDETARVLPAVAFIAEQLKARDEPRSFTGFSDFFRKWKERVGEPSALVLERHAEVDGRLVAPALDGLLLSLVGDYLAHRQGT